MYILAFLMKLQKIKIYVETMSTKRVQPLHPLVQPQGQPCSHAQVSEQGGCVICISLIFSLCRMVAHKG